MLVYIRKAKQIAQKNLEILGKFQAIAESTYAQNRSVFADVVKAQAQAGQVRYDPTSRYILSVLSRATATPMVAIFSLVLSFLGKGMDWENMAFQSCGPRRVSMGAGNQVTESWGSGSAPSIRTFSILAFQAARADAMAGFWSRATVIRS